MRRHEKAHNNAPRCKAKVFVLLPAWKSNAVWANAACVGHPKNLEALRAAGADVEAWVLMYPEAFEFDKDLIRFDHSLIRVSGRQCIAEL